MAVVFVLVGQCGNQLGEELLSQLFEATNYARDPSPFFDNCGKARCVLVDSEPKVVESVLRRSQARYNQVREDCPTFRDGGIFRRENVITGESGCGNCWGLGYNGLTQRIARVERAFQQAKDQGRGDARLLQRTLAAIHAEGSRITKQYGSVRAVENNSYPVCCNKNQEEKQKPLQKQSTTCTSHPPLRRDVKPNDFESIIVIHSLAGGTGSGFASRLLEKLRLYFLSRKCAQLEEENKMDGGEQFSGRRKKSDKIVKSERRNRWDIVDIPFSSQNYDDNIFDGENHNKIAKRKPIYVRNLSRDDFLKVKKEEDAHSEVDGMTGLYGDRVRASFILTITVTPFMAGDNAVQSINGTLTLHSILNSADAVVLLRNDDAMFCVPQPIVVPSALATAISTLFKKGSGEAIGSSTAVRGGKEAFQGGHSCGNISVGNPTPQSLYDVNTVFASQLLVVLLFGRVYGVISLIMDQVCPPSISEEEEHDENTVLTSKKISYDVDLGSSGGRDDVCMTMKSGKILTLIPLPHRVFSRFNYSVYYSSLFRLATDMFGTFFAANKEENYINTLYLIPYENLHVQHISKQLAITDIHYTSSHMNLKKQHRALASATKLTRTLSPSHLLTFDDSVPHIPPSYHTFTTPYPALEASSHTTNVPLPYRLATTGKLCSHLMTLWPVLVLNELVEVVNEVLYPMLRDCYVKCKEGAFMHVFEAAGVEREYVQLCVRRVAEMLYREN